MVASMLFSEAYKCPGGDSLFHLLPRLVPEDISTPGVSMNILSLGPWRAELSQPCTHRIAYCDAMRCATKGRCLP
jgi:hypothetical protein